MATTHLALDEVRSLCVSALSKVGLNQFSSECIADAVHAAERDGCASHGLFRLPGYCAALTTGKVDGTTEPVVHDVAPGVVRVDAAGGFAPPAIIAGRPLLVAKARANGVAALAIHNSLHFAALWWEVEALADDGLVAMAFVNSRSFVAHHGGRSRIYGTNPMAFGFPRADGTPPLVWDQASSTMARGEMQLALRDGHALQPGAAIDSDGNPTTDPTAALDGAQLTFGGHKGTAIALMVELLAAGLTGSNLSYEAAAADPEWNGPSNAGEFILAIDPAVVTGGDRVGFTAHCEGLFERILEDEGTRLPSDRRYANRKVSPTEGIDIPTSLYDDIQKLCDGTVRTTGRF
jgi:delta1-piperideine-2-carboxylate reductase